MKRRKQFTQRSEPAISGVEVVTGERAQDEATRRGLPWLTYSGGVRIDGGEFFIRGGSVTLFRGTDMVKQWEDSLAGIRWVRAGWGESLYCQINGEVAIACAFGITQVSSSGSANTPTVPSWMAGGQVAIVSHSAIDANMSLESPNLQWWDSSLGGTFDLRTVPGLPLSDSVYFSRMPVPKSIRQRWTGQVAGTVVTTANTPPGRVALAYTREAGTFRTNFYAAIQVTAAVSALVSNAVIIGCSSDVPAGTDTGLVGGGTWASGALLSTFSKAIWFLLPQLPTANQRSVEVAVNLPALAKDASDNQRLCLAACCIDNSVANTNTPTWAGSMGYLGTSVFGRLGNVQRLGIRFSS